MNLPSLRSALPLVLLLLLAVPAMARPVDQYLRLRRQAEFDPRVTYAQVEAGPASYTGKAFEVRGTVDGFVRKESAVSFLLTLADARQKGLYLDAPAEDVPLVTSSSHQPVRALVRVKEGIVGNVVPLEVMALANDAQVTQREREAVATESRGASERTVRQTAALPQRSSLRVASRGSSGRPVIRGSGFGVSALAMRYLTPEAQSVYPVYRQYIYGCNRRLNEDQLDQITVSLLHFSQRYKVDPRLVIAMIIAESDFDPFSTSNKGAMGLAQLMPDEARANHLTNPYDPVSNVGVAVGLLRDKLDRYKSVPLPDGQYSLDQIRLALAAYNAGPGAVHKYGGVPPYRETQNYIKKILRIYASLCGA